MTRTVILWRALLCLPFLAFIVVIGFLFAEVQVACEFMVLTIDSVFKRVEQWCREGARP